MGFGIAQDVVYNTASFDTGNDMFNEDADIGHELILRFLFRTEFLISRLGTHLRRDTVIPQWFQASKAAAASDGHAVHC